MLKTFPAVTMLQPTFADLLERTPLTPQQVADHLGCHLTTVYRYRRNQPPPKKLVLERMRELAALQTPAVDEHSFTFIDLFAGIGGMRLGAQALGGRCVFTSEWNSFSRTTYQRNFEDGPEHPFAGDITQVDPETEIPPHDLLVAGFPCQPFSIAGVSKKNALGRPHGFRCKEQGNLFFEIAEILDKRRPAAFLLENVKNLQNHDQGRTFAQIMKTLADELQYEVHFRVINAKGLVPQNRERIFIVGFRERTEFNFEDLRIPPPESGPKLASILHPEDGTESPEEPYTSGPVGKVSERYVLTQHLWNYLQRYKERHEAAGHGFGFGLVKPTETARTLSARYFKDGSEILIDRGKNRRPRRLTPRECARLMGFKRPDGGPFRIPVSDTQAYKQFGNAVVVPVVEAVVRHMLPHLLRLAGGRQLQLDFDADRLAANG